MKQWLYDWGGLNLAAYQAINANHGAWLDGLALAVNWAGEPDRFALFLAGLAMLAWRRFSQACASPGARIWILSLVTFATGYLLDAIVLTVLGAAFDFPPPPMLDAPGGPLGTRTGIQHSFPSNHAAFAVLFAATLWPLWRHAGARIGLVVFVLSVCLARAYLLRDMPADLFFGAGISLGIVLALRAALTRWTRREADRLGL